MKKISNFNGFWACLVVGILFVSTMMSAPGLLNAQPRGQVTGVVTDASTGKTMWGANVMIKGTNFGAATDRFGKYRIANIPQGTYTLEVSFIGYDEFTTELTFTVDNLSVTLDVSMNVGVVVGEVVTIDGQREGQMRALSQQRTAPDIRNVVAREQMEKFPDYNAADVVKRLPGVAVQRTMGESRYVLIRGTEPRLSSITMNGEKLSSTRRKERYSQLDIVGSNQMASIEVVKALTPDMDANAIGGAVNVVTRSGFDYPKRRIEFNGGGGFQNLGGGPSFQGKFAYNDRFGKNKNFGIALTANYDRAAQHTHTQRATWGEEEDALGGVIPFALQEFRMQPTRFIKTRYGFGLDLEFRPNDNHRFFARGNYNKFDDRGLASSRYRIRINKGDYVDATHITDAKLLRSSKNRLEALMQSFYSVGGASQFGNLGVDYSVSYSYGEEIHPDEIATDWDFDEKVDLVLDLSDPLSPTWDITNMDDALQHDADMYSFGGLEDAPTTSTMKNTIATLNFKVPYRLGSIPSEFKFGGKLRMEKKTRGDETWKYKWTGDGDITLDDFAEEEDYDNFHFGNYFVGPLPDEDKIRPWWEEEQDVGLTGGQDVVKSKANTFDGKEDVYAYYAMTTNTFGRLVFLGGFRHEITKAEYNSTEFQYDADGDLASTSAITGTNEYGNFLPMVHLRYNISKMTKIRAAYTQTISRPNYQDLAPTSTVNAQDEIISQGNTELLPTKATSFDVMGEHYFRSIGLISAGFFYKSLSDIIYQETSQVSGGLYDGYFLTHPVNGGEATLYGFELAFQQQFTFLPGFLSGFGFYGNYTHSWAETELTERKGFLPGSAGDTGNMALIYEKGGFSSRFSVSFQGEYIMGIGKDTDHDIYNDKHIQLDFSASQALFNGLDLYVEAINLNNRPQFYYIGTIDRPTEVRRFGFQIRTGLKWTIG